MAATHRSSASSSGGSSGTTTSGGTKGPPTNPSDPLTRKTMTGTTSSQGSVNSQSLEPSTLRLGADTASLDRTSDSVRPNPPLL
jgi:hypothetical protein